MKPFVTPAEADIIIKFLNRTDIKGAESDAHAMVKIKLGAIRDGRELPDPPTADVTELKGVGGRGTTEE